MNFITLLWLLTALAFRSSCGNETDIDAPVDALRAIASVPKFVLLVATVDIPMLECLTADLTAFDASAGTATYIWHIGGQDGQKQQDFPVHYVLSKGSDRGVAFMNADTSNPIPAQVVYSDYKSCLISKMYPGSQEVCFLWVSPETVAAVPEACTTAMKDKCGGGVVLYKDDTCK
ncbi:hypothetical protein V5799_013649 [Amblyomma americanum]|uniref:Lipocalin-5 1 n=1 Tax=Amblyomma americanum TaxID=6943 RepID=A0AAQ4E5B1_AMBAM